MKSHPALAVAALLIVAVVAACNTGSDPRLFQPPESVPPADSPAASGPQGSGAPLQVNVVLTNAGCVADRTTVPAGAIVFSVVNQGGDAVSELELMRGDQILEERENLTPGLTATFLVKLQPGTYVLACPGASTPQTPFEVTPAS